MKASSLNLRAIAMALAGAIVLVVVGLLFAVPLVALAQFTFRQGTDGSLTTAHYTALADPANASTYQPVFDGLGASLVIAVIAVAIVLLVLLPAQVITALHHPRLRRILEFVCLVPITVPVVVLVVGFVPVYQVVAQVFPMYWMGLGMRSAFLPEAAAAQEIGGSWRTAETVAVLGTWAVVGALVTPVLLRRMARRQTGSQVQAAREATMQWVR